jgi:hypothetical protein
MLFGGREVDSHRNPAFESEAVSVSPRRSRGRQCDGERVAAQNHERWMAPNPGQRASPMRFSLALTTTAFP